jgi:hypothetical protein
MFNRVYISAAYNNNNNNNNNCGSYNSDIFTGKITTTNTTTTYMYPKTHIAYARYQTYFNPDSLDSNIRRLCCY